MAYIYGSGRTMQQAMLREQQLLLIKFQRGWIGFRVVEAKGPYDYNHFGFVTGEAGLANSALGPGAGAPLSGQATPRNFRQADNNNEIFEIIKDTARSIWQVFWSMKSDSRALRVYTAIPEDQFGLSLEFKVGGNTFAGDADRFWGWTLTGADSPIWMETDVGSWFQLPNMRVGFAIFNPPGATEVSDPVLRWKIRRLKIRALKPLKFKDDAEILYKCLRGDQTCLKWEPEKGPMDWEQFQLWNTVPTVWSGEDGVVESDTIKKLSDLKKGIGLEGLTKAEQKLAIKGGGVF